MRVSPAPNTVFAIEWLALVKLVGKGVGKRPAKSVEEKEVSVVKLDNLKSLRHNLEL